jgi:hypothetical protein
LKKNKSKRKKQNNESQIYSIYNQNILSNLTKELSILDIDSLFGNINLTEFDLPLSLLAMYEVLIVNDKKQFLLKGFETIGATCMISRFTINNDEIYSLCEDIALFENLENKDAIYAELDFLPNLGSGNILKKRDFRKWSIPILKDSPNLKYENSIPLSDICVCIENDEIALYSIKLKKRIFPVLSSAYNTFLSRSSIFSFLCDLSIERFHTPFSFYDFFYSQGIRSIPRIVSNNIIFSPRAWIVEGFKNNKLTLDNEILAYIENWRRDNGLPDIVCFSEGDNNLQVDFNNSISVLSFYYIAKEKRIIPFQECFFNSELILKDSNGSFYRNEILMPLYKEIK